MDARFERREAVVGGRPMFYRQSAASGCGELRSWPEVVLVHGLGLSGRYMLPVASHLAGHYPVFLPDLPGFGDSSPPPGVLDVAGLADALAEWIEVVGLERPALLGNSFGCQIIVELAARHGRLLDRAVLQGPTAPPEERTWVRQAVRWQQNQPFNPPALGPVTWGDYRKCGWWRLLRTFQLSLRDPIEAKLASVTCPALVVRGELDPICRRPWAEDVARRLPRGQLAEIPGVAHTLVYTAPAELCAAARPFLSAPSGPETMPAEEEPRHAGGVSS